jgi:hypothetical protein
LLRLGTARLLPSRLGTRQTAVRARLGRSLALPRLWIATERLFGKPSAIRPLSLRETVRMKVLRALARASGDAGR